MEFSYYIVDISDPQDPGSSHSSYEECCNILKEENNPNLRICGGHLGFDHIKEEIENGMDLGKISAFCRS